jgi:hypothetical protein
METRTVVGTGGVVGNDDQMRRRRCPWLRIRIMDIGWVPGTVFGTGIRSHPSFVLLSLVSRLNKCNKCPVRVDATLRI